jgi:hypothetical protein
MLNEAAHVPQGFNYFLLIVINLCGSHTIPLV